VIDREFSVEGSPVVRVNIRSGRVSVEEGEPGIVRLRVDSSDPRFEIHQRLDTIEATGGGRTYATVTVPPLAEVEIESSSGDITANGPLARLAASTASGNIDFQTTERLRAKTASGQIRGNRVDGEAECVTASGSIKISRLMERTDLSTASGEVRLGECAGVIHCATLSGSVRVERVTGPAAKFKSMSGDVKLGIPPRTRVELDAESMSGKVSLPEPSARTEAPERELALKVRLVSGDLKVERALS
jgi:DUF4097 and DUF4098 domain-containing protein YvlB